MIGKAKLEKYVRSHDPRCLHTVVQFLEVAGWSPEVEDWLKKYLRKVRLEGFIVTPKDDSGLAYIDESCPRCDELMQGIRMPACEVRRTGRAYYKECSSCTYYAEIFVKDGVEVEIKGG